MKITQNKNNYNFNAIIDNHATPITIMTIKENIYNQCNTIPIHERYGNLWKSKIMYEVHDIHRESITMYEKHKLLR